MLIEFTVKNYRSIKDAQVLSLAKAKGDELEASNSFVPTAPASVPLLRSATIYGANSAGKSNVVNALKAMKTIVCTSASNGQAGDKMPVKPFLFDDDTAEAATEFEIVFISDNIRYQYGFSVTKYQIIEEWLFAFPHGRPQNWFSRTNNPTTGKSSYKFGDSLLGSKMVWKNATRANALFLSTAVQLNSEQLQPVFDWFRHQLRLSGVDGLGADFTASLCEQPANKDDIVHFLQAADIDIHDIQLDEEPFDTNKLPNDLPVHLKEQLAKQLQDSVLLDIKMVHKTANDKLVRLDIDDESDGTQALFAFAGPIIDVLRNGFILVIDELHSHFHPKLVQYLVSLFHSNETNPHNAQLIFTTHETSILNQDIFRRDQIWFCEKNDEQATKLYPLTDFSPRKDRENIESGYLAGRYGGLPFIREFKL